VSTADKSDLDSSKLEVNDVDNEKKKEEEDYWEWQAKQLAYLKLPVFRQTPLAQMRSFSTEKTELRRQKQKRRVIDITHDEIE